MNKLRNIKVSVLLLAALAMLVVLVMAVRDDRQLRISAQPSLDTEALPNMEDVAATTSATAVMSEARYVGEDAQGRRWEVLANQAAQEGNVQDSTLRLEGVMARWSDGEDVNLRAGRGLYRMVSQTLVLEDGVQVEGQGLVMTMAAAEVDVAASALESFGGPVKVAGPMGGYDVVLTASKFVLAERGNVLVFTGRVHGVLVE